MLEQEIASFSHFIKPVVGIQYFRELPKGIATPSAYFPVPEMRGREHSFGRYRNSFVLYLKIFGRDSMESYAAASEIVKRAQSAGKRIPLYGMDGIRSGGNFLIRAMNVKTIDVGVTQITVEWDSFGTYMRGKSEKALELYFLGLASSRE